jgi:tetratricopeptide (TPR) repeat protein
LSEINPENKLLTAYCVQYALGKTPNEGKELPIYHREEVERWSEDSLRCVVADDARFRQANIHLARQDTSAALAAFRAVPERHPRSPYADRSLFRAASLLEASGRPAAAVEVYGRLLSDYPKSLLAGDARGRLRVLRRSQG